MPAPRGISVRVLGPVSGLANRACRLPVVIPAFGWPVSPTVASWHAPTVAYRCGGSTGIRRPLNGPSPPTGRRATCRPLSGHPHLFPVEPPRRNRMGHPRTAEILPHRGGFKAKESGSERSPGGLGYPHFRAGGERRADMSKHIQKKPLAVDLTRFLSL
jgi:hypothetical protein